MRRYWLIGFWQRSKRSFQVSSIQRSHSGDHASCSMACPGARRRIRLLYVSHLSPSTCRTYRGVGRESRMLQHAMHGNVAQKGSAGADEKERQFITHVLQADYSTCNCIVDLPYIQDATYAILYSRTSPLSCGEYCLWRKFDPP